MRVASLDFIRGVAVLGILAINIAGFAGPSIGTLTPNLPDPATPIDEAAFAVGFVVFEGKMRALFAILFGASMALFLDRAAAAGRDGDLLQARRLGWLLLFGWLHYALLWWGDILFAYAACGFVVLALHRQPERLLLPAAAALFLVLHLQGLLSLLPVSVAEEAARLGLANPAQQGIYGQYRSYIEVASAAERDQYIGGYWHVLTTKMRLNPWWPLRSVPESFGEYVPHMILGLVLQRRRFFAGAWPRRWMLALGLGATALGLAATLVALGWLWPRHFPVAAMDLAVRYGLAPVHTLTAMGYAALLVLAAPSAAGTRLGRRLTAAGQMAFSNYIGMSLVMTSLFYGWGLALFGRVTPLGHWGFVLLGWGLMLAWSAPWLHRWKRGPLEWLWRSATEGHRLPNRR
jgi:uncharacterized protein